MPEHLAKHAATGGPHWGIFMIRNDARLQKLAETLCLVWEASEAEEWIDYVDWFPF